MATGINHKYGFLQDLPEEEPRADLMEEGQAEAILQKCCPTEYKDLKEEEVRAADSSYTLYCKKVVIQVIGT